MIGIALPLAAMGIVGYGAYRSIRNKLEFHERLSRSEGELDDFGWWHRLLYYELSKVTMHFNGKTFGRMEIESYYHVGLSVAHQIDGPDLRVSCPPFKGMDEYVNRRMDYLGERYRDQLCGFYLQITDSVPSFALGPTCIGFVPRRDDDVLRNFSFDTFCKIHGIGMDRLVLCMKDLRRRFYGRLVDDGIMGADRIV